MPSLLSSEFPFFTVTSLFIIIIVNINIRQITLMYKILYKFLNKLGFLHISNHIFQRHNVCLILLQLDSKLFSLVRVHCFLTISGNISIEQLVCYMRTKLKNWNIFRAPASVYTHKKKPKFYSWAMKNKHYCII